MFEVFKHLNIPVTRFTHLHETKSSYFILNKKYYSAEDLGAVGPDYSIDEEKVLEVYQLFGMVDDPPKNKTTGKVLNPFTLCYDLVEQKLDLNKFCKEDR